MRLKAILFLWAGTAVITAAAATEMNRRNIDADYLPPIPEKNAVLPLSRADEEKIAAYSSFAQALDSEKTPAGFPYLMRALAADPASESLFGFTLEKLDKEGKTGEYCDELRRIAMNNPGLPRLNQDVALLLIKYKKSQEARALLENALADRDPDTMPPLELGYYCNLVVILTSIYAGQENFAKGDDLLDDACDVEALRDNLKLLRSAVLFYYAASKKASAEAHWWILDSDREKYRRRMEKYLARIETLCRDKADNHTLSVYLSNLYDLLGMSDKAAVLLQERLLAAPDDANAMILLAALYTRQHKYDEAFLLWRQVVAVQKQPSPALLLAMADTAFLCHRYQDAEKAIEECLRFGVNNKLMRYRLALCYYNSMQWQKAYLALNGHADSFPSCHLLSMICMQAEKYDEALTAMLAAKSFAEQENLNHYLDDGFYLTLLFFCEKTGRIQLLDDYCALFRKLFPDKTALVDNLQGFIYADRNIRIPEAERLARAAVAAGPDKPEYLDTLAWALYRAGKYQEALRYILSAVSLSNGVPNAVIADHAGDIYRALGDVPNAVRMWRMAEEIYSRETDPAKIAAKIAAAQRLPRHTETPSGK